MMAEGRRKGISKWKLGFSTALLCYFFVFFKASLRASQQHVTLTSLLMLTTTTTTTTDLVGNNRPESLPNGNYMTKKDNKEQRSGNQEESSRLLLLSVPFYVYTELWWPENNLTLGGIPVQDLEKVEGLERKHLDDFYFGKAALEHPLRTLDPSQAKLFVIPTLLNLVAEDYRFLERGICVTVANISSIKRKQQQICGHKQLYSHIQQVLTGSPWFRRFGGRDHIFVQSHWAHLVQRKAVLFSTVLHKCNAIHFEDRKWNDEDRISFPSYYVGKHMCQSSGARKVVVPKRTQDVIFVGAMKNTTYFKPRKLACSFLLTSNSSTFSPTKLPLLRIERCGKGSTCPALLRAKLGLHIRGDTLGSSRLVDNIMTGTVPVFTSAEQYEILPKWIDWDAISYLVLIRENMASHLYDILQDDQLYQQKLATLQRTKVLFDWTTLVPFDTYMFMFQCRLWPPECDTSRPAFTQYAPVLRPLLNNTLSEQEIYFQKRKAILEVKKKKQQRTYVKQRIAHLETKKKKISKK